MSQPSRSPPLPVQSEAWIEAFARQCTPQLYEDARRFATRRANAVRRAGGAVDDYYVQELVQDILGDTRTGVLSWDPDDKTLAQHVWDAIRTRTNHDRLRAKRYRHEPIDVFDPEAPTDLLGEIEATLEDRATAAGAAVAMPAAAVFDELRALAGFVPSVVSLIDALAGGASTKEDVTRLTGFSEKEYHAVRARLGRLVAKLARRMRSRRRLKKGA